MKRIALIDGDMDAALRVRFALERDGYAVSRFACGREGHAAVRSGGFDFVLLDDDCAPLCRELRQDPATKELPIVILIRRGGERDFSADDFITKPPDSREVVARVRAVWQRLHVAPDEPDVYEDGAVRLDSRTFRVCVDGTEVKLARKEFELLWLLVRNASAVVPRERIRCEVWHLANDVETRTIDAHVRNLRKKIGAERIVTVVGEGYRYRTTHHS